MLLKRKHLYSGKIIDLIVDQIEVEGEPRIREVVRHPGGVVILAELEDGRIPFVRQHRYPMNRMLLELPAGKVDPGEDPRVSAGRELEEETGFRSDSFQHVFSFYSTPGFCDELLHLYYTDQVRETSTQPEPDEDIIVEVHGLEEAMKLSLRGEIRDAKTLLAVFWRYWTRTESRGQSPISGS